MNIQFHRSLSNLNYACDVTYFRRPYLEVQAYEDLLIAESSDFFFPISIDHEKAISISKSPFGSVLVKNGNLEKSGGFIKECISELHQNEIQEIEIHHPSPIYPNFISSEQWINNGFDLAYEEINQHISLSNNWEESIHKMQERKLKQLTEEGFEFREIPLSELKVAHQFLTVCRQAQGLQINISWEALKGLTDAMPDRYQCFGVFREGRISALCIAVNVTDDIAYYYLPGTSPMFRSHSPMVLLIAGMVNHYRNNGFKILDLGISSMYGKAQETLQLFKERMGSETSKKPIFKLSL